MMCRRPAAVLLLLIYPSCPTGARGQSGTIQPGDHGDLVESTRPVPAFSIPVVDLNEHSRRQTVVDREKGQYLGHPTTLLLENGKTILCVYPKGHGRGPIVYKRSENGGRTWSDRLPTPKNWETSLETPTLHRVIDAKGKKRVVLFSGLYPVRLSVSEDDGRSWSELKAVGDWGGIVTMASVVELNNGPGLYLALFHDDGRFRRKGGTVTTTSTLYKSVSKDGGLTWSEPESIFKSNKVFLCEPGAIRSPDGRQIAILLRENFHGRNSHVMFSDDEGTSWTEPRELAASLNGDRHVAKYGPDGRLFVSFRDIPTKGEFSPTANDWVGWVGTYDDLVKGREGQYRIRFKKNYKDGDCAYPGVELLPSGTFVVTTYGHWVPNESPYILSVRFTLGEIDHLAEEQLRAGVRGNAVTDSPPQISELCPLSPTLRGGEGRGEGAETPRIVAISLFANWSRRWVREVSYVGTGPCRGRGDPDPEDP